MTCCFFIVVIRSNFLYAVWLWYTNYFLNIGLDYKKTERKSLYSGFWHFENIFIQYITPWQNSNYCYCTIGSIQSSLFCLMSIPLNYKYFTRISNQCCLVCLHYHIYLIIFYLRSSLRFILITLSVISHLGISFVISVMF